MLGGFKNITKIPGAAEKDTVYLLSSCCLQDRCACAYARYRYAGPCRIFSSRRGTHFSDSLICLRGELSADSLFFALGDYALYQRIHYPPAAYGCRSSPRKNCLKRERRAEEKITQYTRVWYGYSEYHTGVWYSSRLGEYGGVPRASPLSLHRGGLFV